jgi:hypothetical protein
VPSWRDRMNRPLHMLQSREPKQPIGLPLLSFSSMVLAYIPHVVKETTRRVAQLAVVSQNQRVWTSAHRHP